MQMQQTQLAPRTDFPHVLIVDDDRLVLSAFSRMLGEMPINLHLADSPEAGLRVLNSVPVAVVVSDYRMPRMGGGWFLRQVQTQWPQTVRILITAYGPLPEIQQIVEQAGVHRVLSKPCNPQELRSAVSDALLWRDHMVQSPVEPEGPDREPATLEHRGLQDGFRQAFHAAPDPMVLADWDGKILEFNHAFVQSVGGSLRTALERCSAVLEGWRAPWPAIREALHARGQWQGQLRHATEERYALFTVCAVLDEKKEPCGMCVVQKDLTAFHALEQASRETRYNIPLALARLAEFRDTDTGAHLQCIRAFSWLLAVELARLPKYANVIDEEFLDALYGASPLHDLGKVAIPDTILLKPGKLDDKEWQVMKTHSRIGAEVLAVASAGTVLQQWMEMGRRIALEHHEKWDGSGYPAGLKGEEIHLAARIVALADAYDAITSKRVYKEAMSHDEARRRIVEATGSHFDPDVVWAFLRAEGAFQEVKRAQLNGSCTLEERRSVSSVLRHIDGLLVSLEEDREEHAALASLAAGRIR
jgi:response regulator RpfG family c-di-GMP phosphodiesterase